MPRPTRLSARRPAAVLLLAATLAASPAIACRPFGSYAFVEDGDGGIWFTEGDNNAISRLVPDGRVEAHPLPTPHAEPTSVAVGPRGEVWFVESDGGKVGRLGRDGRIVEFPVGEGHPVQVAVDRRGDAWFTRMSGHENGAGADGGHAGHGGVARALVGRVDGRGRMHAYPVDAGWPTSVAHGRGDRTWVTVLIPGAGDTRPRGRLATLTRDGRWTVAAAWDNSCPGNLAAGPAGTLVFSDHCRGVLGRVGADGRIAEQALPAGTYVQQLSVAPDGVVWFTGDDKGRLGRIATDGAVAYLDRPENGDQTMAVLATRGGDVVFSEFYNYNIDRLRKTGEYVEHLVSIDERRDAREVKEGEFCQIRFAARIAEKAEMDARRAAEVRNGRFVADGAGTEKLVEQKCLACHDARRLLLSRRSDWTPSITRMHAYRDLRGIEALSAEETRRLVAYFNAYYGLTR